MNVDSKEADLWSTAMRVVSGVEHLAAENERLRGWLRRHARFNDELTDRKEWKEIQEFLALG